MPERALVAASDIEGESVQLALRSAASCPEPQTALADCAPRPNKLLLASVAMIGAGAMAVTPVAPTVAELQQRAVALTAAPVAVTESPAAVYGNLLSSAFANVTELGGILAENPFPIVGQILENQAGYAESILNGFASLPESFDAFWTGRNGEVRLQNAVNNIREGNFADAYDELNRFNIYSLTVFAPLYNLLLSAEPSPRVPEGRIGIPEQIALNVADVVRAVFNQGSVVSGSTQSLLGPFIGVNFELALAAEAIKDAVDAGDFAGAATALVNTPGTVLNAFLNGYVNPECEGAACDDVFPGLLNSTSPIVDFVVRIPNAIAEALKPNVPAAPSTDAGTTTLALDVSESPEEPALAAIDAADSATSEKAGLVDVEVVADTTVPAAEAPVTEGDVVVEEGTEELPAEAVPANPVKAISDGVAAAVEDAREGVVNAVTGGRHGSGEESTTSGSESSPKHAEDDAESNSANDDAASDAKSDNASEDKSDTKSDPKSEAKSDVKSDAKSDSKSGSDAKSGGAE
ncbi:hypothetical protein NIIDNTM18_33670 [Mycolicibacterium litorale]|uniref:PE-PGRS family protein n=1 Tax=Mycolicibacterium litorale TaxID=758802 RepID=A0A6S6P6P9_9MYCO|nr:hypothetical protein NIIDNTM18_33670 [Mycolicibacterium litorale]